MNEKALGHIHILRGLLHYHERMMLPLRDIPDCEYASAFADLYADALREGIRCIEQVHGISSADDHERPVDPASAPSIP